MTLNKASESFFGLMAGITKVIGLMGSIMGMENTHGLIRKKMCLNSSKASGTWAKEKMEQYL